MKNIKKLLLIFVRKYKNWKIFKNFIKFLENLEIFLENLENFKKI